MSSKKKMIIAICAFALVVVATIVSVVAVLAAQRVTIKSSINISYNVEHIFGSAKVSYKQGADGYAAWNNAANQAVTTFDANTGDQTEFTLAAVPFSLTEAKPSVTLKFEFQKTNTSVEDFTVGLKADVTTLDNIEFKYGTSETPTDSITATGNDQVLLNTATVSETGENWYVYYVTITIKDTTVNASFAGDLVWSLENVDNQ